MTTLVIGYGNEARGDDGAGPAFAKLVESLDLPDVEVRILHQLVPEVAALLAEVNRAVFVDASCLGGDAAAWIEPIVPRQDESEASHAWTPSALVQLARLLYGRACESWLLSIAGRSFEPGEGFSDEARLGVQHAVILLKGLLEQQRALVADPSTLAMGS